MTEGTLIVKTKKNKKEMRLIFTNFKGDYSQKPITEKMADQIAINLTQKITENAQQEIAVEFEENENQISKIREKGTQWDREEQTLVSRQDKPAAAPTNKTARATNSNSKGDFHNPYNFIPAPPRAEHPELGDGIPKGHGCYHQEYWSGRISVTLETITPLLIPDAANLTEDNNQHKTYPLRVDAAGKPYLPPTSIKGMLRSAYEAVTNSRFGIFEKHENRLAYRLSTSIGLEMVPARIENDEICLYPGTSEVSNNGKPKSDQPMYAAWLERYERNGNNLSNFALKYSDRSLPKHREKVTAWVEKYQKITANRDGRTKIVFSYWKVRKIVPFGENIGGQPQPVNGHGAHQPTGEMKKIDGFVCITNKNIDNKHDERVFFATSTTPPIKVKLTSELREKWIDLISNYQSIHEDEINKQVNGPPALRHAKWSRQVTEGESEKRLNEGTLCYAHVKKIGDDYKVLNLYPVIIPRGLYEVAPNSCLDSTLEPASWIDKLSPADRVFGWVRQNENRQANQKGATSYKGNLRIFKVTCNSDNAIESFGTKGFPLAILGQPNEQQARFYQAEDKEGTPLLDQFSKEQMYSKKEQGLRGRKVYPHHHGLPDEHWQNPKIHRKEPNNGHYQEYRQPSGEDEKTDQNRSIQAWVKPAVKFSFTIDIINLSPVELGALLWLLSLEDNYYHRLGGAKPLGFGSVKLSINWETTDLRTGQGWKQYYSSLVPIQSPDSQEALSCIDLFKQAIEAAYGNGRKFEQVSFIKAFSVMAQGFEDKLPIHYPRITPEINPNGEGFDWFVANEKVGKQEGGLKLSLPSLAEDKGLPINPTT